MSPAPSGANARSSDTRSVTSQSACESGTTSSPAAIAALATSEPTWPRGPISARRMRDETWRKYDSMPRKCGAKLRHSRLDAQRRDHGDDDEKCSAALGNGMMSSTKPCSTIASSAP